MRGRLIEGAIAEFAAHGYDGATTRAIAEHADAHPSQINYHFASKDDLWRAALERLLAELDEATDLVRAGIDTDDARAVFEAMVRGLVRFAAERPELNRIMMHEATAPSERLTWLVDCHLQTRYEAVRTGWRRLVAAGHAAPVRAELVYHSLVGAASLLYANSPEAKLFGIDTADPSLADDHADALTAMFLT